MPADVGAPEPELAGRAQHVGQRARGVVNVSVGDSGSVAGTSVPSQKRSANGRRGSAPVNASRSGPVWDSAKFVAVHPGDHNH